MRRISVIIPVLNDTKALTALLDHLRGVEDRDRMEILVADGGSEGALLFVEEFGARLLKAGRPGRAVQMNLGARHARHEVLYFVHADTLPPRSFVRDINDAMDRGRFVGCFRLKLCPPGFLLNINSYFSRFRTPFSGGGDQSLYLPKRLFMENGGYDETFTIMEDFELAHRLMPRYGYHVIPKDIHASARKYAKNSYFKVNRANYRAFRLYKKGVCPDEIKRKYEEWLK